MNPIEHLLMAARGHQGLPAQIGGQAPPDAGPQDMMQGPPPGMMDAQGPPPGLPASIPPGGGSDKDIASSAAHSLLQAIHEASDPELKAALSTAAAALHKYVVSTEKEHHAALGGKLSPRLMAQAHGAV